MRKTVLLSMFFVFLAVTSASAHPPSKVEVRFDYDAKVLTAVIYHDVQDPQKHFIKKTEIFVNGKILTTDVFEKQNNAKTQTDNYPLLDAKPGDIIMVKAYCNVFGMNQGTLTIKK